MRSGLKLIAVLALAATAFAQQQNSCLIVKHKGTVGRRLIYFALIGVPIAPGANYDYVDSTNFANAKMSYKGKQLEEIQSSGTHVIVLDKFTPEGVSAARQSCAASAAIAPNNGQSKTVQVAAAPPSTEHPIEGYTLSGTGSSSAGSVDGDQTSLGDAARRAKAKKQQSQEAKEPKL